MHEYFLTTKEGKTVFEEKTPDLRLDFLKRLYERGADSVSKDMEFEFPEQLKAVYEGYHLKVLPAYSGFKIAVRVNQKMMKDGELVYRPVIPIPDDLNIMVVFTKRNGALDSYTNTRINSPLPYIYFFANDNLLNPKVFPNLTHLVPEVNANYTYEQGELVSFGDNDIKGYYQTDAGEQWNNFVGTGFANETDRLLLPLQFNYSFPEGSGVTEASFTLKNKDGTILKANSGKSDQAFKEFPLDYSEIRNSLPKADTTSFTKSVFSLEVNGNKGYFRTHYALFSPQIYDKRLWGAASFNTLPLNPEFRLIDSDGYIRRRKKPDAIDFEKAPVFEIPVKTRFAYLRYINERGRSLKMMSELQGYLLEDGEGRLFTTRPKSISKSYFMLAKEGSGDKKYFPNPVNYELKKDRLGRLCMDVLVPKSALFDVN